MFDLSFAPHAGRHVPSLVRTIAFDVHNPRLLVYDYAARTVATPDNIQKYTNIYIKKIYTVINI